MASATARGRSIGRGRGFGVPLRKPGESSADSKPGGNATDASKSLSSNNKASAESDLVKILNDLSEETVTPTVEAASRYISITDPSSSRMKEVVDGLYQRTLKDSEFAPVAVNVANMLCSVESFGGAFRGVLLKNTQEQYKNRESIRTKSTKEWIGLVSLVCELFNQLRTGDAPLKPLAGAACQSMSELLREGKASYDEDDEVDCFYVQFKGIGKLMESVDPAKVDALVGNVRDTILANTTSAKTRCLLLELLELRARDWNINHDVKRYYSDMLADIMSNLE